jgi:hypothetical protein
MDLEQHEISELKKTLPISIAIKTINCLSRTYLSEVFSCLEYQTHSRTSTALACSTTSSEENQPISKSTEILGISVSNDRGAVHTIFDSLSSPSGSTALAENSYA